MPRRAKGAADEVIISDVEQLKAISDPLRLRLIEIASDDPSRSWTAKALAERLGTKQTKLYHHLNLLEERGFLRVAETRMVSGILEKGYAATASSYRLEPGLLGGAVAGDKAIDDMLDAIFTKSRAEIVAAVRSGAITLGEREDSTRSMALWLGGARLSRANARRVIRLIERLAAVDEHEDPDGIEYGLLVGFYPRASQANEEEPER
ncbi:MAG TPA: helix-turn-helix domain-containing protein [Candidatus Limnocylindria bacterium]|nr:helix-turn-helix domain-containing protein [Candidatus Limnocylindria bacterium]